MAESLISKALELLITELYFNLGTQNQDGSPWISNIFYSIDENLNFLWYSRTITQHSQNIKNNSYVALNIAKTDDPENVDALYITADAFEIVNKLELASALAIYAQKMLKNKFVTKKAFSLFVNNPLDFLGKSEFRMYKAVPTKIWKYTSLENWNDKFVDGRVEIDIKDLREQFQQL